MANLRNIQLSVLLLTCFITTGLVADDRETGEYVFPLPEILVTGKQQSQSTSIIIREFTLEDIEALNAHTAADVLMQVPGVNVQYGASSGDARAWIRGYRDRDTLILFDGIPIASPFEGTIDLNEIALDNVSSIKMMKGAPSVIYGTNGMSGVIDVIPRTGWQEHQLSALVELGVHDSQYFRANAGGSHGKLNYFLSGSYDTSDGYDLSDDYISQLNQPAGERVNSDHDRKNVFLYLNSEETPIGNTSLFYNYSDAGHGNPPQAGAIDPDFERLEGITRQTIGLSNHFSFLPLSVKLYYTRNDSTLDVYTDGTYSVLDEREESDDYAYGGMLYTTLPVTDYYNLILSASKNTEVYSSEGVFLNSDRAEVTTYNLAAENQFTLLDDRLTIALGGIFTYFDQTRINQSSNAFSPQVSIAFQATDAISLHASVAQRTRFPKLRELYDRRRGNSDINEQSVETYEAGLKYRHGPSWTSDITYFRSNLHDLIERPSRSDTYQNLETIDIDGVEFASGGWLNENLFGRLAYALISVDEELPGGATRQLRSRPKHTLQTELRYNFPHDIKLSLNGIYVNDLYDLDENDIYRAVSGYFVANMKASWQASERFNTYIAVSNFLDRDYEHKLGYPREGRAVVFGNKMEY